MRRASTASVNRPNPSWMRPAPRSPLLSAQSRQNLSSPAAEPRPTILPFAERPRPSSRPAGNTSSRPRSSTRRCWSPSRRSPAAAGGPRCCRSGESGIVSPDALKEALTDDTAIVSVMHANNELGTMQPVAELAAHRARPKGALFHTDAVQSVGQDSGQRPRARRRSAVAVGAQVQRTEGRRGAVDQARHPHRPDPHRRQARAHPPRRDRERARPSPAWAWPPRRRDRRWPPRPRASAALRDRLEREVLDAGSGHGGERGAASRACRTPPTSASSASKRSRC